MTEHLPNLQTYLGKLASLDAPVLKRLGPGANQADIASFEQATGVHLDPRLSTYFQTVNGIDDDGLLVLQAALLSFGWAPKSLIEAAEQLQIDQDLREQEIFETAEEAALFWPPHFVYIAGESGNGLFVNCQTGSPTFGAIYVRGDSSEPFERYANDLDQLFALFTALVDQKIMYVAGDDDEDWDVGALAVDEDDFDDLALEMTGCSCHDPDLDDEEAAPDWLEP